MAKSKKSLNLFQPNAISSIVESVLQEVADGKPIVAWGSIGDRFTVKAESPDKLIPLHDTFLHYNRFVNGVMARYSVRVKIGDSPFRWDEDPNPANPANYPNSKTRWEEDHGVRIELAGVRSEGRHERYAWYLGEAVTPPLDDRVSPAFTIARELEVINRRTNILGALSELYPNRQFTLDDVIVIGPIEPVPGPHGKDYAKLCYVIPRDAFLEPFKQRESEFIATGVYGRNLLRTGSGPVINSYFQIDLVSPLKTFSVPFQRKLGSFKRGVFAGIADFGSEKVQTLGPILEVTERVKFSRPEYIGNDLRNASVVAIPTARMVTALSGHEKELRALGNYLDPKISDFEYGRSE